MISAKRELLKKMFILGLVMLAIPGWLMTNIVYRESRLMFDKPLVLSTLVIATIGLVLMLISLWLDTYFTKCEISKRELERSLWREEFNHHATWFWKLRNDECKIDPRQ